MTLAQKKLHRVMDQFILQYILHISQLKRFAISYPFTMLRIQIDTHPGKSNLEGKVAVQGENRSVQLFRAFNFVLTGMYIILV